MKIAVKQYEKKYLHETLDIWNEVIEEGIAFPQEEYLNEETGDLFFVSQTYTGLVVDEETDEVLGLYILHPNNVGRCGHIANASYAVKSELRGLHIGERLVQDSLIKAKKLRFQIVQFNAVVDSNIHARHLYERLGFQELGIIPKGFRRKNGHFEDIHLYYYELNK